MRIMSCMPILLIICSGCRHKKIDIGSEFSKIGGHTKKMLDEKVYSEESFALYNINNELKERIEFGLSSDDAVQLALIQNPHLKADFEYLGVAKADFEQAALFRNPHLDFASKIPVNAHSDSPKFVTQYDAHLVFPIADLWQIGARKKVAKDEIEIVSMRISQTILDTYAKTKKAYFDCIAAQSLLILVQEAYKMATFWKDRIYYQKEFGLVTDLDTFFADANMGSYELDVISHRQIEVTAFIKLRFLLGINIASELLPLMQQFQYPEQLPNIQDLLAWALEEHPAMQIARLKVQLAEDRLLFEKKRTIKEAEIGFAFERDFDRPIGPGFYLGVEVPIFDSNAVQIARAKKIITRAQRELYLQQARIRKKVLTVYQKAVAAHQAIKTHNAIVENYEKAVLFAQEQMNAMMFDKAVMLQTQLSLYQAKKMQIMAFYDFVHAWIDLEQAVGKKIENITN